MGLGYKVFQQLHPYSHPKKQDILFHIASGYQNIRSMHFAYSSVTYHKTGNFRVVQFFEDFRSQYQSTKIKICEIFSHFWKIVEELVVYMVAVCGSYLFACG